MSRNSLATIIVFVAGLGIGFIARTAMGTHQRKETHVADLAAIEKLHQEDIEATQSDTREIACLRQPRKKAHDIQLMHSVHEARQHRDHSPANQDSGDPHARSDLVKQQIAGDFEEEISEKENPEDQSVLLVGDGQFLIHRQRGKPNVEAIKKSNNEKQEDKGKNPLPQFLDRSLIKGQREGVYLAHRSHP